MLVAEPCTKPSAFYACCIFLPLEEYSLLATAWAGCYQSPVVVPCNAVLVTEFKLSQQNCLKLSFGTALSTGTVLLGSG